MELGWGPRFWFLKSSQAIMVLLVHKLHVARREVWASAAWQTYQAVGRESSSELGQGTATQAEQGSTYWIKCLTSPLWMSRSERPKNFIFKIWDLEEQGSLNPCANSPWMMVSQGRPIVRQAVMLPPRGCHSSTNHCSFTSPKLWALASASTWLWNGPGDCMN